MRFSLVSFVLLALVSICHALSSSGNRLLVVLDEQDSRENYSKFWADLKDRGFSITYESPKQNPVLSRHGERVYDHLLILPSKLKALGPALTPNILLDFMKEEGNILIALSSNSATPSSLVSFFLEVDIQLPPDRTSLVVDHFNYDTISAQEKHDVLLVSLPDSTKTSEKNYFGNDGVLAVPRAVAQTLGNSSPLLAPILRAPSTAYSYNPSDESETIEELFAVGKQLSLATAMQARNSARLTVLGSSEMLHDTWFDAKVKQRSSDSKQTTTENRAFAKKLSGWAFKELGVLKVGKVEHHLNEALEKEMVADLNPVYRIKNDVTFSIELSEYFDSHYIPYVAPIGDAVQLEFTMLSPYHRLVLDAASHTDNSTIYTTSFQIPDQHGIFNFRVNYKRPFLTNIDEKRTVTVRHFAHDEWPRSWRITGGWVWIAGVWVTIVGWLAFVAVWLYSAPNDKGAKAKKVQ